jgi:N-acetylglucosaminyl-diphospho-decaprenol L-rhamnosyltransferase
MSAAVRVVIVTYSPGPLLDALLDSLPGACSLPYEVVLADNGSTDGVPERAAAERSEVTLVRTGGNVGYGRAANIGARGFEGDWILVANSDLRFEPGAVDEMVAGAARHPRAGAIGPCLMEPDGSIYPSARTLPTLGRGAGHAVLGRIWPKNPWTRAYWADSDSGSEREAEWLSGACLLVRRDAFEQVGGFDPAYFMYFEDVDLGDRLGRAGWLSVYAPAARVHHVGGATTARAPASMVVAHHTSAARYLAGHHSRPVTLALRTALAIRQRAETRRQVP